MPDCEAEERITRALFELEIGWGAGVFDYAKVKHILTGGRDTTHCPGPTQRQDQAA